MKVTSIHAFAEKVALISDIADPIGRATALQLALQGTYVIGGLPSGKKDDGSIQDLIDLGTLASAVEYEAATTDGISTLVEAVRNAYGRLDLLVNSVKCEVESAFVDDSERRFQVEFTDNVSQFYLLTNACLELMNERPKPKIVNVIRNSNDGKGDRSLFTASQKAIESLTSSIASELPNNFRINSVSVVENAEKADSDILGLRKSGTAPDDVARAILFLLSSESTLVNGQTMKLA